MSKNPTCAGRSAEKPVNRLSMWIKRSVESGSARPESELPAPIPHEFQAIIGHRHFR
jgi:hypothetical protein